MSINILPPELMSETIKYLPVKDLKNLSLVSKRSYSFVKDVIFEGFRFTRESNVFITECSFMSKNQVKKIVLSFDQRHRPDPDFINYFQAELASYIHVEHVRIKWRSTALVPLYALLRFIRTENSSIKSVHIDYTAEYYNTNRQLFEAEFPHLSPAGRDNYPSGFEQITIELFNLGRQTWTHDFGIAGNHHRLILWSPLSMLRYSMETLTSLTLVSALAPSSESLDLDRQFDLEDLFSYMPDILFSSVKKLLIFQTRQVCKESFVRMVVLKFPNVEKLSLLSTAGHEVVNPLSPTPYMALKDLRMIKEFNFTTIAYRIGTARFLLPESELDKMAREWFQHLPHQVQLYWYVHGMQNRIQ